MKTTFKKQFEKQIKEVKDQKLKTGILDIILKVENDMVTFSAFHHRKDIYKYFP